MVTKKHQLVVIRPVEHVETEGISTEAREAAERAFINTRKYLGGRPSVIVTQNSSCAIATALIAQKVFKTGMPIIAEILNPKKPHETLAKDHDEILDFLRSHQKEHDNLILVTHLSCVANQSIFANLNLEVHLGWRSPGSITIGDHQIIEYRV